jgi:hypothetical protein
VAEHLTASGVRPAVILSDANFIAGNLRMLFPDSEAMVPGVNPNGLECAQGDLVLAWDLLRHDQPPSVLGGWLGAELGMYSVPPAARLLEIRHSGAAFGFLVLPAGVWSPVLGCTNER